jgi:hypothetical protein
MECISPMGARVGCWIHRRRCAREEDLDDVVDLYVRWWPSRAARRPRRLLSAPVVGHCHRRRQHPSGAAPPRRLPARVAHRLVQARRPAVVPRPSSAALGDAKVSTLINLISNSTISGVAAQWNAVSPLLLRAAKSMTAGPRSARRRT